MTDPKKREFRECGGAVHEIMLVDKGHFNASQPVEYAATDAKRTFWTSSVPMAGQVKAFKCAQCGLISLYGVPK